VVLCKSGGLDEVSDIERVERRVEWELAKLTESAVVTMGRASAAKPVTTTFYEPAKYLVPLNWFADPKKAHLVAFKGGFIP